jgi:tRNA(Ile)-lysidine synthase
VAAVIASVGGAHYPPRLESVERLLVDLRGGFAGGRNLGGCLVLPRRGRVLVCREPAAAAAAAPAPPGQRTSWDGRFVLRLPPTAPFGLSLGANGASQSVAAGVPAAARPTVPVVKGAAGAAGASAAPAARFRPNRPLIQPEFAAFMPS